MLFLVETILVSTLLFIGLRSQEDYLKQSIISESQTLSNLLNTGLGRLLMTMDYVQTENFLNEVLKKEKLDYLVLQDINAQIVSKVGNSPSIKNIKQDKVPSLNLSDGRYDFSVNIGLANEEYGLAVVGIPLKKYQIIRDNWIAYSIKYIVLIMLLSLSLFLFLGYYFTRPLRSLTIAAGKFSDNKLVDILPVHHTDEVGKLTIAFNLMTKRIGQQISLLHEREKALRSEREFLQRVIDGVNEPILVIDLDYSVILENQTASSQHAPDTTESHCYQLLYNRQTRCETHICPMQETIKTKKTQLFTHQREDNDGKIQTIEILASPLYDADKQLIGIIESTRNITERLNLQKNLLEKDEHIQHLAKYDQLTDLPNRILFTDRVEHALEGLKRNKTQIALIMIDIDRFKVFNETLGAKAGDQLLQNIASRLKQTLRKYDSVARIGSDEFAILLEQIKDPKSIMSMISLIQKEINQNPFIYQETEHLISLSLGISIAPLDSENSQELISFAEMALDQVKENGGQQIKFYTSGMNQLIHEQMYLESFLRHSVEENQLVLHYQPQYDLVQNQLIGFEALVRWNHPEEGLVFPDKFIPLAEKNGYIIQIGDWVLSEACRQFVQWQNKSKTNLTMAVNLSALQFRNTKLVDTTRKIIEQYKLDPSQLELEITESMIMHDVDFAIKTMKDLRSLGVSLSIDDFGTGYSSLSYLKQFPVSKLKIDRSFVQDITCDNNDEIIAASIISLSHNMNLKVIAEGVETQEQANLLKRYGCNQVQGYLYSRPISAEQIEEQFFTTGF